MAHHTHDPVEDTLRYTNGVLQCNTITPFNGMQRFQLASELQALIQLVWHLSTKRTTLFLQTCWSTRIVHSTQIVRVIHIRIEPSHCMAKQWDWSNGAVFLVAHLAAHNNGPIKIDQTHTTIFLWTMMMFMQYLNRQMIDKQHQPNKQILTLSLDQSCLSAHIFGISNKLTLNRVDGALPKWDHLHT